MTKSLSKLRIFIQLKLSLIILLSFLLHGCLSVKPATTKSGKKYFETFYVGEDGTQYFIKPLLFKDQEANEDLLVDIAFRYKNEIRDSAIVNFSIKSPNIYKSIDSLKISNSVIDIRNDKIGLLFNEKNKNGFISRFTTKIPVQEIKQLFDKNEWSFVRYNENTANKYKSASKTEKTIDILKDKVFILM